MRILFGIVPVISIAIVAMVEWENIGNEIFFDHFFNHCKQNWFAECIVIIEEHKNGENEVFDITKWM
jgi:hypothetical protein